MEAIDLTGFTGTTKLHRWSPLTDSVLTDGAIALANEARAYWLFDAIDSHLTARGLTEDTEFVSAHLVRTPGTTKAALRLDDGNGVTWMTQAIQYTDFPLDRIQTFACWNGTSWTHMLPSEY